MMWEPCGVYDIEFHRHDLIMCGVMQVPVAFGSSVLELRQALARGLFTDSADISVLNDASTFPSTF